MKHNYKRQIRRVTALLFTSALLAGLAACGSTPETSPDSEVNEVIPDSGDVPVYSNVSEVAESTVSEAESIVSSSETESTSSVTDPEVAESIIDTISEEERQAELEALGPLEGLSHYMDTSMGTMMFYAQADPRWGAYLWGGEDRLDIYGCGPVVLAMIANAFGNQGNVTPIEMAELTDTLGQRVSGSGALHSIVTAGLEPYGLKVESMSDRLTAEDLTELLKSGHVFVALMGPGHFTNGGHFIMIRGINEDGTITVADPAGLEHNTMTYTADFLVGELKTSATDAGGPLWCISKAEDS